MIDGAFGDPFIPKQGVAMIEIEHPELLSREMGHGGPNIGQESGPGRDGRPTTGLDPGQPDGQLAQNLQLPENGGPGMNRPN